jgi:hypothetical protein
VLAVEPWIVQWAPVLSAVFAAIAAVASALAVAQARRAWLASLEPFLSAAVGRDAKRGTLDLIIENGGGGVAQEVAYVLVAGDEYSWVYLPPGFLRGGEGAPVKTKLTPPEGIPPLVVMCRDARGKLQVWDQTKRLRVRSRKPLGPTEVFARVFPHISLEEKRFVEAAMPREGAPRPEVWGPRGG